MCSIEWLKKDPSIFIELLKERNCLWQIKCKEYENKNFKEHCYKNNNFMQPIVYALWTAFVMAKEFRGRI